MNSVSKCLIAFKTKKQFEFEWNIIEYGLAWGYSFVSQQQPTVTTVSRVPCKTPLAISEQLIHFKLQ